MSSEGQFDPGDGPIDPHLWHLTLPAVRAARAAGKNLAESGAYVPRVKLPKYRENTAGWPAVTKSSPVFAPDDAPVLWHEIFALTDSRSSRIPVRDVPALAWAVEEVWFRALRDPAFADGMVLLRIDNVDPQQRRWVESDYMSIVASIISRAEALGAESDQELLELYLPLERARFSPKLTGNVVVPITLTDLGVKESIELDASTSIVPLREELQLARALDALNGSRTPAHLVAAATHAIVVDGVQFDNSPARMRLLHSLGHRDPIPEVVRRKLDWVVESIHILTRSQTGYNQIFVEPNDWTDEWVHDLPPIWKVETVENYPTLASDPLWNAPRVAHNHEHVRRLPEAYSALSEAPKDVRLASRRLFRASMRSSDEDRTLDATIGVEALLLNGHGELGYRMSLRAAAALSDNFPAETIFTLSKRVYDHRSKIAHGVVDPSPSIKFGDHRWESHELAPLLLSLLLESRLLSPNPWTKDTLEGRILEALDRFGTESLDKGQ